MVTVNTSTVNTDLGGNAVYVATLGVGATTPGATTTYPFVYSGSGAPAFSATQGSIFLRNDGTSISSRMYINTTGVSTWTAVSTLA